MLKWTALTLLLLLMFAALVPIIVTRIEIQQARHATELERREGPPAQYPDSRTAVVYFSRSGNTGIAARHLARRLKARLFRLKAPEYRLGLMGWIQALRDARNHGARISPQKIDLSGFDTVYLGSPIWLYSPAPPIWDFVEHNRFDGQRIVLFNTFNSQFKPEYIDDFRTRVMARGARSFEHRFVRRGRMGQQLSTEEMLDIVDTEWQ